MQGSGRQENPVRHVISKRKVDWMKEECGGNTEETKVGDEYEKGNRTHLVYPPDYLHTRRRVYLLEVRGSSSGSWEVEEFAVAEVAKVEVAEAPARRVFAMPARGLSGVHMLGDSEVDAVVVHVQERTKRVNQRRNRAREYGRKENSQAKGVSGLGRASASVNGQAGTSKDSSRVKNSHSPRSWRQKMQAEARQVDTEPRERLGRSALRDLDVSALAFADVGIEGVTKRRYAPSVNRKPYSENKVARSIKKPVTREPKAQEIEQPERTQSKGENVTDGCNTRHSRSALPPGMPRDVQLKFNFPRYELCYLSLHLKGLGILIGVPEWVSKEHQQDPAWRGEPDDGRELRSRFEKGGTLTTGRTKIKRRLGPIPSNAYVDPNYWCTNWFRRDLTIGRLTCVRRQEELNLQFPPKYSRRSDFRGGPLWSATASTGDLSKPNPTSYRREKSNPRLSLAKPG
ncbi:hypothetical protein K438DRAFT_1776681 [Mycena galopus ATCC 62051]|nr:hypothetical protein K438DRAFT_1776681 [Mycena galopus ATCC 62051]